MSQLSRSTTERRGYRRSLALPLAATILFLGGCKQEPLVETNDVPFSLAGIRLGMTKDEALAVRELGSCKQETESVIECFSAPVKIVTGFMGVKVESARYRFRAPDYDRVTGIEFYTSGDSVPAFRLLDRWHELKGRCLDDSALDSVRKVADSDMGVLIDRLRKIGVPAAGYGNLACIKEDGTAITMSSLSDSGGARFSGVRMFFISDVFGRLFEAVLQEHTRIEARNKAISKEFTK